MKVSARKLMAEAYDALEAGQQHIGKAISTRDRQLKITLLQHVRDVIIPSLTTSVTHALERLSGN